MSLCLFADDFVWNGGSPIYKKVKGNKIVNYFCTKAFMITFQTYKPAWFVRIWSTCTVTVIQFVE